MNLVVCFITYLRGFRESKTRILYVTDKVHIKDFNLKSLIDSYTINSSRKKQNILFSYTSDQIRKSRDVNQKIERRELG